MLSPRDLVFSSVPWSHVPLLQRLAPVRAAGFAGISLLPSDVWSLEADGVKVADIARRISEHGLQVAEVDCIGCWLPCQRAVPDGGEFAAILRELTPERVLSTAQRIGARSVTVVEMFGVTPSHDEAVEAFGKICDRAGQSGLLVHIEFLPFGGIPDLKSAWRIVADAGRPNGGLTIDCWHLFRSGSTLQELQGIPGAHIGSVQINDAPAEPCADLMQETMTGRLLPGEGALDVVGVIRALDRIGSKAPIGVEVFSSAQHSQPLGEVAQAWARAAKAVMTKARGEL